MTMMFAILLAALLAGSPTADDGCWARGARAEVSARTSPLDSTVARLGDAEVKVCYSRPSAHGRVILGGLVPFDQAWRLGANEATTLHVPIAVQIGDMKLKPGVYSLYAIPGPKSWQIVVNDLPTRWGIPLDGGVRAHDVGTVTAISEHLDSPVETLTLRLQQADPVALTLTIEWERTRVGMTIRRAQ